MSLTRVSYRRNAADERAPPPSATSTTGVAAAVHQLIVDNVRIAFTVQNRETVLAIFDGLNKNRLLRRNISTDALKGVQFAAEAEGAAGGGQQTTRLRQRVSTSRVTCTYCNLLLRAVTDTPRYVAVGAPSDVRCQHKRRLLVYAATFARRERCQVYRIS
jgi:hypothetical protein